MKKKSYEPVSYYKHYNNKDIDPRVYIINPEKDIKFKKQ